MTMLWCDYSNETSSVVLSNRAIYLVCSSQLFEAVEEILCYDHCSKTSAFGNTFTWPVFEHFSLKKDEFALGFLACN